MKNLSLLMMALFAASILTACGGGESDTNSETASTSNELIIDNGRGTVNGRDTEVPR